MFTTSGEQRYTIDKSAWTALLDLAPKKLPSHREWPQLLAVLRTILRWSRQPDLIEASEYLRASATRQLLERIRPELAFAGVKTNLRATAAVAPAALEQVVQDILADPQVIGPFVVSDPACGSGCSARLGSGVTRWIALRDLPHLDLGTDDTRRSLLLCAAFAAEATTLLAVEAGVDHPNRDALTRCLWLLETGLEL